MHDIVMPELGEGVTEATIVEWLVKPGDSVAKGDLLVEIMTDKVSMEIEAEQAGTLAEILAVAEAEIRIGGLLARLDTRSGGGG